MKLLSLFATLILGLATISFAQDRYGKLEGTVTDSTGAVIPNATVTIRGNAFSRTVQSDSEGFYRVLAVPPGSYKLTTSANGFAASKETTATVILGKATGVNFKLQVAGASADVTVTGDVIAIDTTSSRVQDNITSKKFEQIPKGTNFTTVLQTGSGVQNESKAAGIQIDGSSGAENTFIVDGQEVTNFRTGQLNSNNNLPFQLIQEVQVKKGGFEAEHGGATGGVITVVTKRGSNDYKGEVGTAFRTAKLEGNPRPRETGNPTTLTYINPPKDAYTFFYPSVSLGGPIVKDKLWFFSSYNVQSFITNRNTTYTNGQTERYRVNTRRDYGFTRLDSQLGDKVNIFGSFTYNPVRTHGGLDSVTGIASAVPSSPTLSGAALFDQRGGRRASSIYNFGAIITPTSNWITSIRYGNSYLNEKLGSYGITTGITRVRCFSSTVAIAGCASGFSNVPSTFATIKDISKRRTLDADATVLINDFGGRHNLKFGYQLNKISNDVDQGYFNTGEIRLFYNNRVSRGIGGGPGEIGYAYLQRFGTVGNTSSASHSLYIQDSWTINRLTLNLGLRIEQETVPSFSANGVSIKFGWKDKIAPRIGGSFDVLGDGRWKIYAGWGHFYDRFKYELPRGSFGGDQFTRDYVPILAATPLYTTYTAAYIQANNPLSLNFRVPSNSPTDNRVDPNLKAAKQSSLDVGTEFEMGRNWVFGARYVHKAVITAVEDVGIFDATGNELYFIANPGFGIVGTPLLPGVPTTKANRKYDGITFSANKRLSENYFISANYTYSRLFGNYSGLASSDENGRSSPNVNRFFDIPFLGYNLDGVPDDGRLATDRPHVFKLNGGYDINWTGSTNVTRLSGFLRAQNGTPLSTKISAYNANTFLNGRGDLGRTPFFTQTDFALTHSYRFGNDSRYSVVLNIDVINLFNQRIVTNRDETIGAAISASSITGFFPGVTNETQFIQQIFNGGISTQVKDLISRGDAGLSTCGAAGTSNCAGFATDNSFNQPIGYQGPRQVRFGFRFVF